MLLFGSYWQCLNFQRNNVAIVDRRIVSNNYLYIKCIISMLCFYYNLYLHLIDFFKLLVILNNLIGLIKIVNKYILHKPLN